nr:hypothetical protein [Tanacetum cinerariifolium]
NGAVLLENVEGIELDFAALTRKQLLAQRGVPEQISLVVAATQASIELVCHIGLKRDAWPYYPAQPQARYLAEVVVLRRGRRKGKVQSLADVAAQYHAGIQRGRAGVVEALVYEAGVLRKTDAPAQVQVALNNGQRPAIVE